MLNLLRYSQLIALAVLLAVVAALSLLYRGLAFDSMTESEAHANIALTKTFANAIWPSHAGFVRRGAAVANTEGVQKMMPNPLILLVHLVLVIVALLRLRHAKLDELPRVFWAFLVIILPILGPVALFLVAPGTSSRAPAP